jgi:hypothetical protein
VNETFYKLNDGPIFNVSTNGQPTISTEGNNTLEYWSIWNVYGTGLNELPHVTLTGIKLDNTPPTGTITTDIITTQTPTITLILSATDTASGIAQMSLSNDNSVWSNWEPFASSKTWTLQDGDGQKTVSVQFMDNAGLTSTYSYTLTLETQPPTATTIPTWSITMAPTPIPVTTPDLRSTTTPPPDSILLPSIGPTTSPSSSPKPNPTSAPSPSDTQAPIHPQLPEVTVWGLMAFVLSTITLTVLFKKKTANKQPNLEIDCY